MRRASLVLVAGLLLAGTGVASAQEAARDTTRALEARGCCLSEVAAGAPVESFEIEGNEALESGTIKRFLFTEASGRFPWSSEHPLDREEFLKDLRRLYILYQRHGYFGFDIESYTVATENDGDGVDVTITVAEGEPTRVDSLTLAGLEELDRVEDPPTPEELLQAMPLDEGDVFNEIELNASRDTLEAIFKDRGFAYATVLLEYRIRKEARRASITYTVDAGDKYWIGDISVEGAGEVDESLVRRQLRFSSGDLYRLSQIRESQRRIYELALFRRVDLATSLASPDADTLDVNVELSTAPTHVVRVGIGFGTEDLFRVSGSYLDRSLLGSGRQLEVRGQYSQLDREAAVTYRQPSFLVSGLDFSTTAFLRFENELNYTVQRIGVTGRVGYRFDPRLQGRASLTAERDDFSDFDPGVIIPELGQDFINPSRLLFADVGVSYDGTDSLFMPSEGSRADANYQLGVPVFGDYAYHKLTFLATRYLSLAPGWVLAGKVLPGVIFVYAGEDSRVPLFQRLFAGGSTSVRGYERRTLGPLAFPASDPDNPDEFVPVGGRGLFETSLELRFPLRGSFRGVGFVDAGNVYDRPGDVGLGDLAFTPGLGLRYVTPIGPIRLDVARRSSNDEPFLPRWVFHISIGNAF